MNEQDTVTAPSPDLPSDDAAIDDDPVFALLLQQTQHAVQTKVHGVETSKGSMRIVLGRYEVERLAGKGGMGTVLAAEDVWLERRVALKIVNTPGAKQRRRLVREGVALAKLSHPNVVQVHDVELGERGEHAYVAMEYVEGTTLARWQTDEPRSVAEILEKYLQAARGVSAAHQVGIVHRDFKPHNVLVDTTGVVKVADFGLASAIAPDDGDEDDSATRTLERAVTTGTETSVGLTPGYCAPEQLRGEPAGERADQFSFCVALYEALTGVLPFGSSRVPERFEQAVARGVAARAETSKIPRRVARVLARGLALRPVDRLGDMTAIIAALEPRPSRWPWLGVGLVPVAAVLTAMLMPESQVEVAVDPCAYEGDVRPLVHASRGAAWGFIDEHTTAYRESWRVASQDLCRAGRRGEIEGDALQQAQACLDTAAREFDLVVELVTAEGSTTDPFSALGNLRAPGLCMLGGRPSYGAADPELQREFDELRALQLAGRNEEALPKARALHERARASGDVVILARVSFLMGKLSSLMNAAEAAARELEEAAMHAEGLGDDVLALDAYAELIDVAANLSPEPSDGARWERLGEAKLRRTGAHGSEVAGQYYSAVANLAYRQHDFQAALEHGRHAQRLMEATLGEDGLATLVTRTNQAAALVAAKRPMEAIAEYQQVLEIRRRRYGERHPSTIHDELDLAFAHMIAGEHAQALGGFERVEALARPATTQALEQLEASALTRQCEILVGDKEYEKAAPVCDRAFGMMPRLAGDDRGLQAMRAVLLGKQGLMLVTREQLEPALALLDQERELLLGMTPHNADMLAVNTSIRCVVLDALERTRECAEALSQGRRWYEAAGRLRELENVSEVLGLGPPQLELEPPGASQR